MPHCADTIAPGAASGREGPGSYLQGHRPAAVTARGARPRRFRAELAVTFGRACVWVLLLHPVRTRDRTRDRTVPAPCPVPARFRNAFETWQILACEGVAMLYYNKATKPVGIYANLRHRLGCRVRRFGLDARPGMMPTRMPCEREMTAHAVGCDDEGGAAMRMMRDGLRASGRRMDVRAWMRGRMQGSCLQRMAARTGMGC